MTYIENGFLKDSTGALIISGVTPGGSGTGVNYYATDAELPDDVEGHPVVLVLEDSLAEGSAALRYWSGDDWLIIGLSGGGTVNSDFIDVASNLAGITSGKTLIWDADNGQFIPGVMS